MKTLSWKCRGLGQTATVPALCELVRVRNPDVIFLFETLSFSVRLEALRVKLKFDFCLSLDCIGHSGGITVLWRSNTNVSVLGYSRNHIDLLVSDLNGNWRLTGFYGFPERGRRRLSWNFLQNLASQSDLPWACIGDFNNLLSSSEKRGRVEHPQWLFRGFREAVADCHLIDIPLKGYPFTWSWGRDHNNVVEERLDRAMGNPSWHSRFPNAILHNLIAPRSDHNPILLDTDPRWVRARRNSFHFDNRWLMEGDLKNVVNKCWHGFEDQNIFYKLKATSEVLSIWGSKTDLNFRVNKRELEQKLTGREEYYKARRDLGRLLVQEEIFWKQRAKIFWLRDGDLNTKFFHRTASSRKKRNKILKLKNGEGIWVDNQQDLCTLVYSYFQQLFTTTPLMDNMDEFLEPISPMVTAEQNEELTKYFTMAEFTKAIKQMHPDKSSGPDGFNPAFFQNYWNIVGADVFEEGKN